MATRVNRAATAGNKKGGKAGRRNRSAQLYDTRQSLDADENREAFDTQSRETVARSHNASSGLPQEPKKAHRFTVTSNSFSDGGDIPRNFTQDGEDNSPELSWNGAPSYSAEFAVVCEDLDSRSSADQSVILWLVYRIPASTRSLPGAIPRGEDVPLIPGALQGTNSFGSLGYRGPRPPFSEHWHHYRFRVFALDQALTDLRPGMTWEEFSRSMEGRVIGEAEVVGRYRSTRASRAA